jgi:SAM-dependent methyltransferase
MENVWDSLAQIHYDRLSTERDITFHKIFFPLITNIVQNLPEFNTYDVLDIGCGVGFLTNLISKYVRSILGVDSSKTSIDIAMKYNKTEKIEFKLEDIRVFANSNRQGFDFVISHLALHVIEDLDMSLNSISSCLKKGGRFLFSIPHPRFWALSSDVGSWNFKRINPYKYDSPSVQQNSITIDGKEFVTPYFHRPVEFYSSALDKSGFAVERIIEPFPDQELLLENNKKPWQYPRFMFMLCVKS